ncbi:MAG: FAD-dependent oxidoreductase [Candidatus Acidiferrales bacterium]
MTETRRDFLKFVVAGSVAAGCPVNLSLLAAENGPDPQVDGEYFAVCHEVRDGHPFATPPVASRHDVVIVGGGLSGLSAAYFLRGRDFLLLEKEPHWGGNAYLEEYQDQAFATGSAFDETGSASAQLAREIGLQLLPINCPDPTIVAGKWIADTWRSGLDALPYSPSVRESFKKFRAEIQALNPDKDVQQLDNVPFSNYMKGYAPEIRQWWDGYGLSNWGAQSNDVSTFVAAGELQGMLVDQDDRITLPGGNGALSRQLSATLQPKYAEQMIGGATVVSVDPQTTEVLITYVHEDELRAVAAKCVIMATPKFITVRLVAGLPDAQRDAMLSFRYCPYPVINMIFEKPIYNRAYDTWCPGNTFTDFIVADWVLQKQPGYVQKNNILTFYTPISEDHRDRLLTVEGCQKIAQSVLQDFRELTQGFGAAEPVEVRMYRRGHPMFLPTPGTFTKVIPAANQPFGRIAFANTDSVGPVSDAPGAVEAARRAAEWAEKQITAPPHSAAKSAEAVGH